MKADEMDKYEVTFEVSYNVEAEDRNDALDKATEEFCRDFHEQLKDKEFRLDSLFGSNVNKNETE